MSRNGQVLRVLLLTLVGGVLSVETLQPTAQARTVADDDESVIPLEFLQRASQKLGEIPVLVRLSGLCCVGRLLLTEVVDWIAL